jgi:hypothetical protein
MKKYMSVDEMQEDPEFETQFVQEFTHLLSGSTVILELSGADAWALLGQIQLACRLPSNNGPTREAVERIGRSIQAAVASAGALAIVAEAGWSGVAESRDDGSRLGRSH